MKQMLKIEMERAFRGAAFKVALAIGMIILYYSSLYRFYLRLIILWNIMFQ